MPQRGGFLKGETECELSNAFHPSALKINIPLLGLQSVKPDGDNLTMEKLARQQQTVLWDDPHEGMPDIYTWQWSENLIIKDSSVNKKMRETKRKLFMVIFVPQRCFCFLRNWEEILATSTANENVFVPRPHGEKQ